MAPRLGAVIPPGEYRLLAYDQQGRELLRAPFQPRLANDFDGAAWPEGVCFLGIFRDGALFQAIQTVKNKRK